MPGSSVHMFTSPTDSASHLWVGLAQSVAISPGEMVDIESRLGFHDRRRFETFGSAKRRREFLAGRWLLHQACLDFLGSESASLIFDSGPDGVVRILPGTCPIGIGVSLSHTGTWVACALMRTNSTGTGIGIGIDIESMRPRDYCAMDEAAFSIGQHVPLRMLPAECHREEFYLRWTRHEAGFKSRGGAQPSPPCHAYSYVVHDALMLSLCTTDPIRSLGCMAIREWRPDHGFSILPAIRPIEPHHVTTPIRRVASGHRR